MVHSVLICYPNIFFLFHSVLRNKSQDRDTNEHTINVVSLIYHIIWYIIKNTVSIYLKYNKFFDRVTRAFFPCYMTCRLNFEIGQYENLLHLLNVYILDVIVSFYDSFFINFFFLQQKIFWKIYSTRQF